jgi:hypothetical protein
MQNWQQRQRCMPKGRSGYMAASSSSILDPFTTVAKPQQTSSTATSKQHGSAAAAHPVAASQFAGKTMLVPAAAGTAAAVDSTMSTSTGLARQVAAAAASLAAAAAAQARSRPSTPRYPGLKAEAAAVSAADGSAAQGWLHWKQAAGVPLQGAHSEAQAAFSAAAVATYAAASAAPGVLLQEGAMSLHEHQLVQQMQQRVATEQAPVSLPAAALAPTDHGSRTAKNVRHAARALQRLRLKQAEQAAAAAQAAAQLPAIGTAAAPPAMPAASCESHAPRNAVAIYLQLAGNVTATGSQPTATGVTGSGWDARTGLMLQQLQQAQQMVTRRCITEGAACAVASASQASGPCQASNNYAMPRSSAEGVSSSRQALDMQPSLAAAAAAVDSKSSRCSSSLSELSHHSSGSQGWLSAMQVSSAGSCSSSSYASAEPYSEDAAAAAVQKDVAFDMQLPASVLEELLSATAELDSGKDADPAGTAGAAAAAHCAPQVAAAAAAAMAAFAADAAAAAAAAGKDDADTPEARQQLPPAPAPCSRPSSAHSATICSSLADTAQSALSYALPGHLLLRTPFVGLQGDDDDYVAEALELYYGADACKDLVHVQGRRYVAARKQGGAKKRLVWHVFVR